jgi:gamma-glutamylcyclotransferase (GGCT)/AIG2-like uncharacterized protein YtfP
MEEYINKLDSIFEGEEKAFSYDQQREQDKKKSHYQEKFIEKAQKYVEEMESVFKRGGEDKIRKHLYKIEKEIRDELDQEEEFKTLKMPDDLTPLLRAEIKGYEYDGEPLTKGENNG